MLAGCSPGRRVSAGRQGMTLIGFMIRAGVRVNGRWVEACWVVPYGGAHLR